MKFLALALTLLASATAQNNNLTCDNVGLPTCAGKNGEIGMWVCRTSKKKGSKTLCRDPLKTNSERDQCGTCEGDSITSAATCPSECACTKNSGEEGMRLTLQRKDGTTKNKCVTMDQATNILTTRKRPAACCGEFVTTTTTMAPPTTEAATTTTEIMATTTTEMMATTEAATTTEMMATTEAATTTEMMATTEAAATTTEMMATTEAAT